MAKKAELLERATELKLEVSDKNTIAEIEAAIAAAGAIDTEAEIVVEEKSTAKAGKRSEKSLREAEEKATMEAEAMAQDKAVRFAKTMKPASKAQGYGNKN